MSNNTSVRPRAPLRVVAKKINWQKDQPAPREAFLLIHLCFPQSDNGGIYVPKMTGGRPSGHAVGKALDVMLSVYKPVEKVIGDSLFGAMIASAYTAGIDHVIWNRQIWSRQHPHVRPFIGTYNNGEAKNPHADHVHIEWTFAGSQMCRADFIEGKLQAVEAPRAIETQLGILQSNLDELGIYRGSNSRL